MLYFNIAANFEEIISSHTIPSLTQDDINMLNNLRRTNAIDSVIKNLPFEKPHKLMDLLLNSTKAFRVLYYQFPCQWKAMERSSRLPSLYTEASVMLIPKSDEQPTRKNTITK